MAEINDIDSGNPSNLAEVSGVAVSSPVVTTVLPTAARVELTNNAPIATAATSTTPFGTATADQLDDLIATVIQIRAGLITLGLFVDATANAD